MPSWFPSYTNCSTPSGWYNIPVWALALIGGAGLAGLIAAAAGGALALGVAAFMATVCLAFITFCNWWLNIRLICLGGDRSAMGTVYHLEPPSPTFDAFALGDYDTDYSFNLLLWGFIPQNELPNSYVSNQWSPTALSTLLSDYPFLAPLLPKFELILPQQSMASLNLSFTGQDVESADEPSPQPAGGSSQHFLLHCEIEGPGMNDLRTLMWVLFGLFVAAAVLYAIPIIGPILSWILSLLAFLAFLFGGAAITHDDASPPAGGGFGGQLNAYDASGSGPVDLVYVYGRWVYDSLHSGWNELHPLHYMIKVGEIYRPSPAPPPPSPPPPTPPNIQQQYDNAFAVINSPSTPNIQAQPQNQWRLHPLLDGCLGQTPYPSPPPSVIQ